MAKLAKKLVTVIDSGQGAAGWLGGRGEKVTSFLWTLAHTSN